MDKKDKWQSVCACIAAILIGILLLNILILQSISKQIKQEPKEAKISVILIEKKDCYECFNATGVLEALKQIPNTKIKSQKTLDYKEREAKKLIEKYELKQVPIIIITGDIEKIKTEGILEVKDALLINTPPVYYDLKEQKTIGKVEAIILLDDLCEKCVDLKIIISNLKTIGVQIEERVVDIKTKEGTGLAKKYKITKIPTIIFSKELLSYEILKQSWESVGSIEEDGMLIMRQIPPPYLENEKLVGLVEIIYLNDKSCKECYDTTIHKKLFESTFKMAFGSEKEIDISSKDGKNLLRQFNITKVPTIILSGDINKYTALAQSWEQLGTIHSDKYVFRNLELIGAIYKDLNTGKIVNSTQEKSYG